jgi:crotonobetainyl-CoA:carnitine CoA-transferase CaiB-like acyl-CoA transferase
VLAGPVCGQVLADLGADVVKVERPGMGDETREWGPPFLPAAAASGEAKGPSAYFLSCNRGKRSLALDISTAAGRSVLDDLIRAADVVIENFLPDALTKFGLTPQRLKELNPQLVVVSISGYGRTGPLANKPGYDLVIQATAGIMSITGPPEGPPMKIGVAIADVITGLYGAISALAGLVARGKYSSGGSYDLALADCTLASLVNVAQGALVSGQRPRRWGNAHPQIVPYEAFATADGYMVLAVGNDAQFQRFCRAGQREELSADARFATNPQRVRNRDTLIPLLQPLMRAHTTAAWGELLSQHDVPHAPVLSLDEILASPQVLAREMVQPAEDSAGRRYKLLGNPIKSTAAADSSEARLPPGLGEHSEEVLQTWLNYDGGRLNELRAANVIAQP